MRRIDKIYRVLMVGLAACGGVEEIDLSAYQKELVEARDTCAESIALATWPAFDEAIRENWDKTIQYAEEPTVPPSLDDRLQGAGLSVTIGHPNGIFQIGRMFDLTVKYTQGNDIFKFEDTGFHYSFMRKGHYKFEHAYTAIESDDLGNLVIFPDYSVCEATEATYKKEMDYDVHYTDPKTKISADRIYTATQDGRQVSMRVGKDGTDYVVRACISNSCKDFRTDDVAYMQRLERSLYPQGAVPSKDFHDWRKEFVSTLEQSGYY